MRLITTDSSQANQRLDKFLMKYMNNAPKSFIYKMLRKKNIKLNDKRAEGSEILKAGDSIKLFLSDETINSFMSERQIVPREQQFAVVYEDENIAVVLKPAGLSVQPDRDNRDNSLNDQLLYYLYQRGQFDTSAEAVFKPSICNRLDRNTAGLVVMGKNARAARLINDAFRKKTVEKYYLTVVKGVVSSSGRVEGWHTKDSDTNKAFVSNVPCEGAAYMLTEYRPLKTKNGFTLLQIDLKTGKSHQIRACMAHIDHRVAGDRKYGDKDTNAFFKKNFGLENQLLFSYKLIFHFNNEEDRLLNYLDGKVIEADTAVLRGLNAYKRLNTSIADAIDYMTD